MIFLTNWNSYDKITDNERKKIISELDYIFKIDQKYAGIPSKDFEKKYGFKKAWEIFEAKRDSVGIDNQARIKKLYLNYGYLGHKEVGKDNSAKFWISIQHADNDIEFQKQMLKELKKQIQINNADKSQYAMLEDRVAVNTKQKQRFGSQVTYNEFEQAIPKFGLIDSLNIEKLRSDFGLESFKEYYNGMTLRFFEMNKQSLSEKGVTKPKLYE